MKKFVLVVALIALTFNVMSQERKVYRDTYNTGFDNVIKLNPLSLFVTHVSVSYERFLGGRTSLQLQGGYLFGGTIRGVRWRGMSLTPEFRYYLTDNQRPKGAYAAGFIRYQSFEAGRESGDEYISINRIGGGAAVGYQFLLGQRFTWDTFIGLHYLSNSVERDGFSTSDIGYFTGNFGVRFGTTLGIAF